MKNHRVVNLWINFARNKVTFGRNIEGERKLQVRLRNTYNLSKKRKKQLQNLFLSEKFEVNVYIPLNAVSLWTK